MFKFESPYQNETLEAERNKLKNRCIEIAKELEDEVFKFPGVQLHTDEKNKNQEASLSDVEKEMIEMSGEPTYQELVDALTTEGLKIVVQGGSLFVTPVTSGRGTLAVAALNIESYMDGTLAELITICRALRK